LDQLYEHISSDTHPFINHLREAKIDAQISDIEYMGYCSKIRKKIIMSNYEFMPLDIISKAGLEGEIVDPRSVASMIRSHSTNQQCLVFAMDSIVQTQFTHTSRVASVETKLEQVLNNQALILKNQNILMSLLNHPSNLLLEPPSTSSSATLTTVAISTNTSSATPSSVSTITPTTSSNNLLAPSKAQALKPVALFINWFSGFVVKCPGGVGAKQSNVNNIFSDKKMLVSIMCMFLQAVPHARKKNSDGTFLEERSDCTSRLRPIAEDAFSKMCEFLFKHKGKRVSSNVTYTTLKGYFYALRPKKQQWPSVLKTDLVLHSINVMETANLVVIHFQD
jgi:hypothetical protein